MRVTSNTFPTALLQQLGSLTSRQARLQNQAATGQRLQLPEDDPAAMRRVLDLQVEAKRVGQYQLNIGRQQEQANASFGALKALKKISDRASEIATLADGLKSPAELAIYEQEVGQLIQQGVQIANSKHRGDYLFAGTRTDQPPFILDKDAAGRATGVSYAGNTEQAATEIAEGVTVTTQIPGVNGAGAGSRGLVTDTDSGADLFSHLISLASHLRNGDTGAIAGTDRSALLKDEDNLIFHLGANGTLQSRLEAAQALLGDRGLSLEKQVSTEADADLAQTLVRLNETQNAYQAALQSGGKILSLSLMDYLH